MKNDKYFILIILSTAELFILSLWFSANAVIPQLAELFDLSNFQISLLSIGVILGFVVGGLFSSIINLPDIIKTKNILIVSAILGAIANLAIIIPGISFGVVLLTRLITGFFLAGAYPPSMKIIATWFKQGRGFAMGMLIAALTLGSGLPYLFNLTQIPNWKFVIIISTVLSLIGALIVALFIKEGPYNTGTTKFDIKNIKIILKNKALRLAYYGYFGHMWELYAVYVWVPLLIKASYESHIGANSNLFFSGGSFMIFFLGAVATAIGGVLADKYGRTNFSIVMLIISGLSSVLIGFTYGNPYLVLIIALIWGTTVIPDSAQYSTMVSELADQKLIGTALTLQTVFGFIIAIISIQLISFLVSTIGWQYAFIALVPGPIFGIISLIKLKASPEAVKIIAGKHR